jgi:hypothetical protein
MRLRLVLFAVLAAGLLPGSMLAAAPAQKTVSAGLGAGPAIPKSTATGSGRIAITLNVQTRKACWTLTVKGLDRKLSAHVHSGAPGRTGKVVLPLGDVYAAKGCVQAPKSVLTAVAGSPGSYYVDVHTGKYVNGAIRGQLHAGA